MICTAPAPTRSSTRSMNWTSAATWRPSTSRSAWKVSGFFEAEHELAVAGSADENGVELFEQRGVGVVERDLDAEGFGELDLDVFERLDVGDGELRGGVFFAAQRRRGRATGTSILSFSASFS